MDKDSEKLKYLNRRMRVRRRLYTDEWTGVKYWRYFLEYRTRFILNCFTWNTLEMTATHGTLEEALAQFRQQRMQARKHKLQVKQWKLLN